MFKLVGHDGIQAAVSVVDDESDALHILFFGKCRKDYLILDRTGAGVAQCIIHDHTARQLLRRIAGGGSLAEEAGRLGLADLPNVVYLGYVSDGEAKSLMENCKAFLFPTLYEGFGIPPLEAIACGAPRVMVSNTPCMREIYGSHADYIDLSTNHGSVDHVTPGRDAAAVLQKYSWEGSARRMLEVLREP